MTLDEAIKHAEEVAEEKLNNAINIRNKMKSETALENAKECEKCADEHRQLAEWLKDYKRLKEQEPKTGHWVEERDDYGEIICWHCSNCYDGSGFITTCKWDYCPNCGAKMESEEV